MTDHATVAMAESSDRTSAPTVDDLCDFLQKPVVWPLDVGGVPVRDVVDDSRELRPGDAYVALPGARWHGLDFEDDAVSAGAVLAISDRPSRALPTVVVDDPRAVVGPLAAWFHGAPSQGIRVYGVTGTNGKTSCAHFLDAGLNAAGQVAGLISGARIRGAGLDLPPVRTTPEAATLQRTLAEFRRGGMSACALEVSSHAVRQHRIDGTMFRAMAFTNLGSDHLDFHGSMEAYYATKATMFAADRTQLAVINVDDSYGARLAEAATATTWTCSTVDPAADVYADDVRCGASGSRFTARTPFGNARVDLQTLGPHQVPNALVAMTSLIADGLDVGAVADGISSLAVVPGRCEPVRAGQSFTAIVDYMHNTTGQRALLPYLRSLTEGRLIVVVGATGGRDRSKRRPLGANAASYANLVIVTDESPEDDDPASIRADVLSGVRDVGSTRVVEEPDRRRALEIAAATARPGDVVVVTGRGSDTVRRYGPRSTHFDDRIELHRAITETLGR